MSEQIRAMVADPPWRFRDKIQGAGRGAAKHYPTMSVSEIQRFPLPDLADDSWLFLWRPEAMQLEAMAVVAAWGFRQVSAFVWVKMPRRRHLWDLRPLLGMGHSVRMSHEVALICKRGKPERLSASVSSVFFATRQEHSRKPNEFFECVETLVPGPYAELFARREREGWTTYGDELTVASP